MPMSLHIMLPDSVGERLRMAASDEDRTMTAVVVRALKQYWGCEDEARPAETVS